MENLVERRKKYMLTQIFVCKITRCLLGDCSVIRFYWSRAASKCSSTNTSALMYRCLSFTCFASCRTVLYCFGERKSCYNNFFTPHIMKNNISYIELLTKSTSEISRKHFRPFFSSPVLNFFPE